MWGLATAFFLRTKVGRYVLAAVTLAGIVLVLWHLFAEKYRKEGRDDVVQQQQEQTRKAARSADEAERAVRDCYRTGGVWSQTENRCNTR